MDRDKLILTLTPPPQQSVVLWADGGIYMYFFKR